MKKNQKTVSTPDESIAELEMTFPTLSGAAFSNAREETLAAGQNVVISVDGVIFEVHPDGTRIERKRIEPPTYIPVGTKVAIR